MQNEKNNQEFPQTTAEPALLSILGQYEITHLREMYNFFNEAFLLFIGNEEFDDSGFRTEWTAHLFYLKELCDGICQVSEEKSKAIKRITGLSDIQSQITIGGIE